MIIQMSKFFCDWCERDFFNSSEFSQHQANCDRRLSIKRRREINFHQIEFLKIANWAQLHNIRKSIFCFSHVEIKKRVFLIRWMSKKNGTCKKNLSFYLIWIMSIFMKTRKKKNCFKFARQKNELRWIFWKLKKSCTFKKNLSFCQMVFLRTITFTKKWQTKKSTRWWLLNMNRIY